MKNRPPSIFNDDDKWFEDENNTRLQFVLGRLNIHTMDLSNDDEVQDIDYFTEQLAAVHGTKAKYIGRISLCYSKTLLNPTHLS